MRTIRRSGFGIDGNIENAPATALSEPRYDSAPPPNRQVARIAGRFATATDIRGRSISEPRLVSTGAKCFYGGRREAKNPRTQVSDFRNTALHRKIEHAASPLNGHFAPRCYVSLSPNAVSCNTYAEGFRNIGLDAYGVRWPDVGRATGGFGDFKIAYAAKRRSGLLNTPGSAVLPPHTNRSILGPARFRGAWASATSKLPRRLGGAHTPFLVNRHCAPERNNAVCI